MFPLVIRFLAFVVLTVSARAGEMRPALVGNGSHALINLINTQRLMNKSPHDAVVFFSCAVSGNGATDSGYTYRGTAGSKALAEAVENALPRSRFIPALYNGKSVSVWFSGTAMFFVTDGKPHLRIYANQNTDDIASGKDFIAPQVILGTDNWEGAKALLEKARVSARNGAVEMQIDVGANGANNGMKLLSEDPPGYNF